jgi:hypothetical protein
MRKLALVLATAATLAVTAVATPSPAHARYYGYGPGIFGGLVAGAARSTIWSSTTFFSNSRMTNDGGSSWLFQ